MALDTLEKTSAESVVAVSRRASLPGLGLALIIFALVAVAWASASNEGESSPTTAPRATSTVPLRAVPGNDGAAIDAGNVPWPDPPTDHDPHVTGRPGSQKPMRPHMDSQTLVYVNDVGRPTVVDLATGDQRELLVAAGRALDTFLVLDGKVVTKDPERSVLPLAGEEPFEVTVYRTESGISGPQSVDPIRDVTGPTLCLDAHGCNGRVVTQGGYSLVSGTAMVIGESWPGSGDPGTVEIVGNFIDSPGWTTKGRWTLFSMSSDPQAEPVQLPTPMAETTVWVFTQRSQHRNPGRE